MYNSGRIMGQKSSYSESYSKKQYLELMMIFLFRISYNELYTKSHNSNIPMKTFITINLSKSGLCVTI